MHELHQPPSCKKIPATRLTSFRGYTTTKSLRGDYGKWAWGGGKGFVGEGGPPTTLHVPKANLKE